MNERVRLSALFLFAVSVVSATAAAQPAEPAAADAPPPAGDMAAPPAPPPTITTPTAAPATWPAAPAAAPPAPMAAPPAPSTALAPVKIDSPSTTIKFGLLAQPQYEAAGTVTQDSMAQNLFLRRARILIGGTLFGTFDYFFDTDFANLFHTTAVGMPATVQKNTPGMNIQDVFITYKPVGDLFKLDVGYMLPPLAHNAVQGAGSLYSWDYFNFSFLHSTAFGSTGNPVGRDAGVQARGLVLDGHLEYRVGLFQGLRNQADPATNDIGSRNFFRATARLQINLLDAEPGFFYAGTYFGAKRILSVGGSFDIQDTYKYWAVDAFADLPMGPGVLTAQVNLAQWNASNNVGFIALPRQTALMAEAGYTISEFHLSPIVRYEQHWVTGGLTDTRIGGGLAFWPYLHNSNLKLFYTRVTQENAAHGANQINLQWQLYFF